MIQPLKKLKISIYTILEITIAILHTVKYSENKKELLTALELQINNGSPSLDKTKHQAGDKLSGLDIRWSQ